LKIQAEFTLAEEGGDYSNIMNFSTGALHFQRNYKEGNDKSLVIFDRLQDNKANYRCDKFHQLDLIYLFYKA
jgi:hypothetical protein